MVGIGFALDRSSSIDLQSLSRLNFYVFIPAIIFIGIYDNPLESGLFDELFLFFTLHTSVLLLVSLLLFSRVPRWRPHWRVMTVSNLTYNVGNFGLPFAALAFGQVGVSVMSVVLMIQTITNFTVCMFIINPEMQEGRTWLKRIVRLPMIWALIAAIVVKWLAIELPSPIYLPMKYLSAGLIPLSLVMIGIQISRCNWRNLLRTGLDLSFMRLIISPLLSLAIILIWSHFSPTSLMGMLPVVLVATGLPVGITAFAMAAESNQNPELASQYVFQTTLLSAVSCSLILLVFQGFTLS